MTVKRKLTEDRRFTPVQLLTEEGDAPSKGVRFRAVVSEGDYINQNNRMYPMDVLWPAFEQVNARLRDFPGTVDHPDPWEGVKQKDIGIRWEGFERDPDGGKQIWGVGRTIGTESGKNLAAIIEADIAVGFSTRTRAAGREERFDGRTVTIIEEMDPPFVDAVTNPSVAHAKLQSFTKESKEMDEELKKALEEAHTARTALAVSEATSAVKAELAEAQAKLAAAEDAVATANKRVAELEAQIAESAKDAAATALEAKLVTLTADDRFGPTIRKRAMQMPGLNIESAEAIVAVCRDIVQDMASAGNEMRDAKEDVGEPKGDLTTEEDKVPANKPASTGDAAMDKLIEDARQGR